MNVHEIIGRSCALFDQDIVQHEVALSEVVESSRFLVVGGAGTIGQAVSREIFKRNPRKLHVVDISENNMVELVRDIRSTIGYKDGDFRTFAIDCGSKEFDALIQSEGGYDYVLNLSALKHVRSEKDPYTLMRLINVNIVNALTTHRAARKSGAKKYFCVSTDKAANPVNMMGASKRIMEIFMMHENDVLPVSTARFANVAFSDGSLLYGFNQRLIKKQPITAPNDVRRYFITPQESGELCLMSCLLGYGRDVFIPKCNDNFQMTRLDEVALRYLEKNGFQPYVCSSEEEARAESKKLISDGKWPVYFFGSDTAGEKEYEEFFTAEEERDFERFHAIGVIKNKDNCPRELMDSFLARVSKMRNNMQYDKQSLVSLFKEVLPKFQHLDTGKYLDGRM